MLRTSRGRSGRIDIDQDRGYSRGMLARGTRDWVTREPLLGTKWSMEYSMFCLGHSLAVAGGLATQYALGRAHRDFEDIVIRSKRPVKRARVIG